MQFFGETHINFVGARRKAFLISAALIIAGLISWPSRGDRISASIFRVEH